VTDIGSGYLRMLGQPEQSAATLDSAAVAVSE